MIIDRIENSGKYAGLHPLFGKAFEFLKKAANMPNGKYEIEGKDLFVMISDNNLRETGEMEAHRKYIDIQLVLEGEEKFLCAPLSACGNVSKQYSEESDIMFFSDQSTVSYIATSGTVSIFYPEDAHAPLMMTAGSGKVRKAIAKIRL